MPRKSSAPVIDPEPFATCDVLGEGMKDVPLSQIIFSPGMSECPRAQFAMFKAGSFPGATPMLFRRPNGELVLLRIRMF